MITAALFAPHCRQHHKQFSSEDPAIWLSADALEIETYDLCCSQSWQINISCDFSVTRSKT